MLYFSIIGKIHENVFMRSKIWLVYLPSFTENMCVKHILLEFMFAYKKVRNSKNQTYFKTIALLVLY